MICSVADCQKENHKNYPTRCWIHRAKKWAQPIVEPVVAPIAEVEELKVDDSIIDDVIQEHACRRLYASMVPKQIGETTNICGCGTVVKQRLDRQHRNTVKHGKWSRLHPMEDQQCWRYVEMRAQILKQRKEWLKGYIAQL
jgi:hypothetical protein